MNEELAQKLIKDHPGVLDNLDYGIACGDGWYSIIDRFICSTAGYSAAFSVGENGDKECVHYTFPKIQISTIKEKFGALRIYYSEDYSGDEWQKIIHDYPEQANKVMTEIRLYLRGCSRMAEEMSSVTCEVTGKPGTLHVRGGWFKVLCDEEAVKQEYIKYDQNN